MIRAVNPYTDLAVQIIITLTDDPGKVEKFIEELHLLLKGINHNFDTDLIGLPQDWSKDAKPISS